MRTLVDLAARLASDQLEAAINEADKHDLIDPEQLRAKLDALAGAPGVATLRELLDRRTFTLTDTELERRFLRIVRSGGLPEPRTQRHLNSFRVDLRYHRTPAQQARDRDATRPTLLPASRRCASRTTR